MLPESVLNVVTEAEPYVQNKRDTSPILKAATSSQFSIAYSSSKGEEKVL